MPSRNVQQFDDRQRTRIPNSSNGDGGIDSNIRRTQAWLLLQRRPLRLDVPDTRSAAVAPIRQSGYRWYLHRVQRPTTSLCGNRRTRVDRWWCRSLRDCDFSFDLVQNVERFARSWPAVATLFARCHYYQPTALNGGWRMLKWVRLFILSHIP